MRPIAFCATGKTGLGHLRRVTNIATELVARQPERKLVLLSNAPLDGLAQAERSHYASVEQVSRTDMAARLQALAPAAAVVDTAVIPDLHGVGSPLCLVLRETVAAKLADFALSERRPWDAVIVPNPGREWLPPPGLVTTDRIEAVGWIYRRPASEGVGLDLGTSAMTRTLLVASGGGGNEHTRALFRSEVEALIAALRAALTVPVSVLQVVGARAAGTPLAPGVDREVDCGAALNEAFAQVDVVVSTVGYNSVLELALTDVPVVLAPIARTFDDQDDRARHWGALLGMRHDPADPRRTAEWMARVLSARERRSPVPLGPSGAARAAEIIAALAK